MVKVEHLSKTYDNSTLVKALDNISFEVNKGEVLGILGPNGAGKSTLVKVLATILNYDSGEIYIQNQSIKQMANYRKNFTVALQNSSLELWLSVEENLRIYGKFFGLEKKELAKKTDEVIELLGLSGYRKKRASELSGGYKKRLQLARSFLVDTPVMILDEPTAGLDPIVKKEIIDLLKNKAKEGKSIIFTTQVISEAEALCDRLLIINNGKKIASGSIDEIRDILDTKKQVVFEFDELTDSKIKEANYLCQNRGLIAPSQLNNRLVFLIKRDISSKKIINELYQHLSPEGITTKEPNLEELFIELVKEVTI